MAATTQLVTADAGRRGKDVRSDCWFHVTPASSGGIELQLQSKVEAMYGDANRRLITEILHRLEIKNIRVEMEDSGALPWVMMARLECALRRGGYSIGLGYLPEFADHARNAATERERFRRSRLYLPGNEPKFMINAGIHKPDGVILDLEDSVSPPEKDAARLLVRNALRTLDFFGCERMVRINQGELGLLDLDFIVPHNIHVILIPKVESPDQIRTVDAHIQKILGTSSDHRTATVKERSSQSPVPSPQSPIFLMPIIESALGAIRAYEIAVSSPNICALTIGLEDYTADIGCERTLEGKESFWARAQVINAAKAARLQAIDTVFSDVSDMEGLRNSVLEAKSLGFEGKGCIHPRQIQVVHDAFAPGEKELEKARKIVAAFNEAQEKGLAAVALGSKMIDPPVVKRALRIVKQAEMLNL